MLFEYTKGSTSTDLFGRYETISESKEFIGQKPTDLRQLSNIEPSSSLQVRAHNAEIWFNGVRGGSLGSGPSFRLS